MGYLYGGTILIIDLTNEKISRKPTSLYADKFLGGRGINAKIIYDELKPGVKPLDPGNVITFGMGPLTGTLFPGTSRVDVMAKSPVTNLLGAANMGGFWAAEVKYAGYDHIVIKGKAEKPVYILIEDDEVMIKPADHIWGQDTYETPQIICDELGDPEIKVICIGPAGENLVTYASIQTSVGDSAARTGMGAVLGSKNLKAIAVRGTKGVKVADPEKFLEVCKEAHDKIKSTASYERYSTRGSVDSEYAYVLSGWEASGDNHKTSGDWDKEGKTCFSAFSQKYCYKRAGCFGCPIHCMENYQVPGVGGAVISCELYSQMTWELRNDDMMLWYESVRDCQRLGIDNTSVTIFISWLMELYEEGIITKEETDGIPMEWGSREAILGMVHKIVNREGIGDIFADGMKATAEKIKKGAIEYAMQVKNNPMYGLNPRFKASAIAYAIGRRGDLIQDLDVIGEPTVIVTPKNFYFDEDAQKEIIESAYDAAEALTGSKDTADPYKYGGKAVGVAKLGLEYTVADMTGTCKWHTTWLGMPIVPADQAKILSAGFGKDVGEDELMEISKRVRNLERAFEVREGLTREDETLPKKEFINPIRRGEYKGMTLDRDEFEKMKDEYYSFRGWDIKTGIPTEETLKKLDLEDVAEELIKGGIIHG
jgi:aldehyde:ferredoxin oxidoreductase